MPVPAGGGGQSLLFTLEEFASYLQNPDIDQGAAGLARELATTEIRLAAGAAVYDALDDVSGFKAVALAVAKRVVLNPSGLRSTSIDDYSETYASESLAAAYLTDEERQRIDLVLGRSSTAFTIRPYGSPDRTGFRRCRI